MRVKKWFLRIFLTVLLLLVLLGVAVQAVLWTDMPGNWVLSAVQQKLQLRVGAQTFRTGWAGQTRLGGVTMGLPLASEAFLQAKDFSMEHTGLLSLITGRPLRVRTIRINGADLLVRQESSGRWNLEEVAELIRRAGGGKSADSQPTSQGIPQLPEVVVTDARVRLIDLKGRQATLYPLAFHGKPDGPLVWSYDGRVGTDASELLSVTGDVAPGADWAHRMDIKLTNAAHVARPFVGTNSVAETFELQGHWSGRVDNNVKGRLDLSRLFVDGYTATGPLNITFAQAGVTTIEPAGLVITPPASAAYPPGRAMGGAIAVDAKSISAKGLTIALAGGDLRITGNYAIASGAADLSAAWDKLVFPKGTTHSGTLNATLTQPWPGQPVIDATLTSDGVNGKDPWAGTVKLKGSGKAWDQITWAIDAPRLTFASAGQTYNLDGLAAALATRGDLLTLDALTVPPGNLFGNWKRGTLVTRGGQYRFSTGEWNVYLAGEGWPLSPDGKSPAAVQIDASGGRQWTWLRQFYLDGGGVRVWADGAISYRARGMPADLNVYAWFPPVDYTWHERDRDVREDVQLTGALESELHLSGGVSPLALDIGGTLYAKSFRAKGHALGDVAMKVRGTADPEHLNVQTTQLEMLSGIWGITVDHRFATRQTRTEVSLDKLSLAQLDNFAAAPPNVRGTLAGRWVVHLPGTNVQAMTAEGKYTIHKLGRFRPAPPTTSPAVIAAIDQVTAADGAGAGAATRASHVSIPPSTTGPQTVAVIPAVHRPTTRPRAATTTTTAPVEVDIILLADEVTGTVHAGGGMVHLDPIVAHLGSGEAKLTASFPINAPRQIHLEGAVANWPYDIGGQGEHKAEALVGLQTNVDLDLAKVTAEGKLTTTATLFRGKSTLMTVSADAEIRRRRLDLKSIKGSGLGGRIDGDGFIYLDTPLQSAGRVDWQNVDADAITALVPALKGLHGRYSGAVRFSPASPATDPAATGPFAIGGTLKAADANWNGLHIGDAQFMAYGDQDRASLDRFTWNVAEGTLKGWARFTQYDGDRFAHFDLNLDKLSLDQIIRAARPAGQVHKPIPGLLSGSVKAAGSPFTPEGRRRASGEANVHVADSDLGNVAVVNLLYSVMSVQMGPPKPTGRGYATARLEGERLEIPIIRYFNRGVDLWASAAVVNVFKGPSSEIEGTAAGSARPLKDLKLPFMADVDKIVSALQGAVATASIEGTLGNPKPKVIPFASSGEAFRRFMIGEVKNEVRGTAGR